MSEQTKLSVEEAAEAYIKPFAHQLHLGQEESVKNDFKAGWEAHATNDANLVPLEKVIGVLESAAKKTGRSSNTKLIKDLITQIKNLTKE